jgi:hypothetical protein
MVVITNSFIIQGHIDSRLCWNNSLDKAVQHMQIVSVADIFPNHPLVKAWIFPQEMYHFLWI